jgi:hypothetical protein
MHCYYLQVGTNCELPSDSVFPYQPTDVDKMLYCRNEYKMQQCPRYLQFIASKKQENAVNSPLVNVTQTQSNQNNNTNSNSTKIKATFNEKVTQAFEKAHNNVVFAQITEEDKDAINSRLLLLETEIKKQPNERDKTKIQRIGDWIKKNGSTAFQFIAPILKELLEKKS